MSRLATITDDQIWAACRYGHRFDIGQLTADETRQYRRLAKDGRVVVVRALFPFLHSGSYQKPCYVALEDGIFHPHRYCTGTLLPLATLPDGGF